MPERADSKGGHAEVNRPYARDLRAGDRLPEYARFPLPFPTGRSRRCKVRGCGKVDLLDEAFGGFSTEEQCGLGKERFERFGFGFGSGERR